MEVLLEVVDNESFNMMSPSNVAIVFGPTIMGSSSGAFDMNQIEVSVSVDKSRSDCIRLLSLEEIRLQRLFLFLPLGVHFRAHVSF